MEKFADLSKLEIKDLKEKLRHLERIIEFKISERLWSA